jgi:hypothetical protein
VAVVVLKEGMFDVVATQLSAAGAGVGIIQNNNSGVFWRVTQISVITIPVSSGCTCVVAPQIGFVDTAYFAGTGDVAGGDPPIYLYQGQTITLTWSAGPANGFGECTYYYDELMNQ